MGQLSSQKTETEKERERERERERKRKRKRKKISSAAITKAQSEGGLEARLVKVG